MYDEKKSVVRKRELKIQFDTKKNTIQVFPKEWITPLICVIYDDKKKHIYGCTTNRACINIDISDFKNGFYTLIVEDDEERRVNIFEKN